MKLSDVKPLIDEWFATHTAEDLKKVLISLGMKEEDFEDETVIHYDDLPLEDALETLHKEMIDYVNNEEISKDKFVYFVDTLGSIINKHWPYNM